jgi:hypothetical protein
MLIHVLNWHGRVLWVLMNGLVFSCINAQTFYTRQRLQIRCLYMKYSYSSGCDQYTTAAK